MFDPKKVQIGDALLYKYKPGDIICHVIDLFTLGKRYIHVSCYIGGGKVIEAHLKTGVAEHVLTEDEKKLIDIYRLPKGLFPTSQGKLCLYLKSKIGLEYELEAFPSAFFRSTISSIFGLTKFGRAKPIFNKPNKFFCSELVSMAYYECFNIKLHKDIHPRSMVPSDFSRCILKKIS